MARNKKRKKKKATPSVKLKPQNYIRKTGRKLPIYECRIDEGWRDMGIAQIIISRQKSNGELVIGVYLVDVWCLGLKDTFFKERMSTFEYEEWIEFLEQQRNIPIIKCEPTLAFNLIYGAIEFAEDLGFDPAKDFRITEYLLDDVEAIEYMDIEFGKEGMPSFMAGPYDNIDRILAILDKSIGPGNYHFTGPINAPQDDIDFFDVTDELPHELVDQKFASLEDIHAQSSYMLQVGIARRILSDHGGNLDDLLAFGYDDDYIAEVTDHVIEEFDEIRKAEGGDLEPDEEYYDSLAETIEFILDKIIEHGDTDFLLDADYQPSPKTYTDEELAKMTTEEKFEYGNHLLDFKPIRIRTEVFIKRVARMVLFKQTEDATLEFIDASLQQTIKEAFFSKLKELSDEPESIDENLDYYLDFIDQAILDYDIVKAPTDQTNTP